MAITILFWWHLIDFIVYSIIRLPNNWALQGVIYRTIPRETLLVILFLPLIPFILLDLYIYTYNIAKLYETKICVKRKNRQPIYPAKEKAKVTKL